MRSRRDLPVHAVLAPLCFGAAVFLTHAGSAFGQTEIGPPGKPPPRVGEVTGTVAIHGCSVDPRDLMVRARPIEANTEAGRPANPGSARTLVTQAFASRAPGARSGEFAFAIRGLASGLPYRVGVKIVGKSKERCPRLAWDVDRDPMVIGGDLPLAFAGFAVPSELEILGSAEGRDREAWVGGDAVDFSDPTRATRQLRWRTTVPGATGGELQISLAPFPKIDSRAGPCSEDASTVIKRVRFTVNPGAWARPDPVDFNKLIYGDRPDDGGRVAGMSSDALIHPIVGSLDAATITRLELGRPLHLRVVPTDIEGRLICDPDTAGVPTQVRIARVIHELLKSSGSPSTRLEIARVYYSKAEFDTRPWDGETCYRVTQKHVIPSQFGIFGWTSWELLALGAGKVHYDSGQYYPFSIPAGAQFCVCNNCSDDDGWFESFTETFGSVVTGLVDAVAKLVNSAAELWEDIQNYAVAAVADGITALPLGVDCDLTCRDALKTGLEVGLATMGVPPPLPNFDQLVDQGFDYLAAQAMSQVGVPGPISDYLNDELSDAGKKFMTQAVANMKQSPYSIAKLPNWLVPDLRFERAFLTIDLWGPGVANSEAFANAPAMILNNDDVYVGAFVRLPRKIPNKASGTPLRFLLALEPNLGGLPSPPAHYDAYNTARVDKNNWIKQRYTHGCFNAWFVGILSEPFDIVNLYSFDIHADTGAPGPCGP